MRRDLIALPENSKVWVYASDTFIDDDKANEIKSHLYNFSMQWKSHGQDVESYVHLFHNRFIVFVADDSKHVSGCSIDSSVHLVQQIEQHYGLNFFNRMQYYYIEDDQIKSIHHNQMNQAISEGQISEDSLFFNNLVNNKDQFIHQWISPIKDSWYKKYLN